MYNIVLAEDDESSRSNIQELLMMKGYNTECASEGLAALEMIQASMPDLIITDITMPGLDGFELLEILRANPETACLPVIFLSSRVEYQDIEKGLKCGANAYITKPFKALCLLSAIEECLERQALLKQDLSNNS
ncbi:MAG: response regulator transcription factor [Ignavibacteriales bacterium]